MSIIETNVAIPLSSHHHSHCCPQKQYYINYKSTLVDTLKILPRVIIYKKPLKIGNSYETLISVTNQGLHNRRLTYTTDSDDVSINAYPEHLMDNFLEADNSLQIAICVKPKTNNNINRQRYVFIQTEHPNLKIPVPIIILTSSDGCFGLPKEIIFPSTCMRTFTFYELILYNKDSKKLAFNLKCNNPKLSVMVSTCNIPKRDYIRILLKLNCNDMNEVRDFVKFKFGSDTYEIPFIHQPIEWTLFLDTLYLQFEPIKFNRTATKSFRICNESQHYIKFHINFIEENHTTAKESQKYVNPAPPPPPPSSSIILSQIDCCNGAKNKEIHQNDRFPRKHFHLQPQCGTLSPNTSCHINVTFQPIIQEDFPSLDTPPFPIATTLEVKAQNGLQCELKRISIQGFINGPDIDIIPKFVDFRNVYFGEEHCVQIKVINIDGITDCHVDFHDFISHDDANVVVTPEEGFDLKPCQSAWFNLQFFAKIVGKFMVKLLFKVRNGNLFSTMIRGYAQHVRVKCFPDVLDLGTLPVCVPQKRLVLLMNPLTVPITVQCSVPEDGSETPLVLNVNDTDEHLPIHVKDPIIYLNDCHRDEESRNGKIASSLEDTEEGVAIPDKQIDSSLLSYNSVMVEDNSSLTSFSTEFQEQALDFIPDMASNLLYYLKKIKIFDKPEMEKKVVEEALSSLLQTPYFYDMDKYKNYCNMDWNSISSDPKEIYYNNEIIYLNPNTGKAISIVVIPNVIGRQHKYIELRVCPILPPPSSDDEDPSLCQIVDSQHLVSKLWIEYNCSVPEIMWDNVIDMQDPLYAGELYEFEMIFENCSKIGGFFYYDAIPNSDFGAMRFLNERWKYFVEPESIVRVPCAVEFKKTGFVTLLGLIKFVGVNAGFPFHIKSEILPPRIDYTPQQIVQKLWVLEKQNYCVYIENMTPTTTWFSLKLKDESHASIYPEGGQLAPTGHGIYSILKVYYTDPGIYKNTLYITMQYETVKKIPITLHVEGMPIFFEPDIRISDLNIDVVLCTTEEEYQADKTNYSKVIRVINKGEHQYRISIAKTKCSSKPTCTISPQCKAKINVNPQKLVMGPKSQGYLLISTSACEECSIEHEFRIDVVDLSEPIIKQSSCFAIKVQFIFPHLQWNRRGITMNYYRTHMHKEQPQWEILKLTNVTDNFMDLVALRLTGPFLMKENFEGQLAKELLFSMEGLETKEFFIVLDKRAFGNRLGTSQDGRITCCANSRIQKSVNIKVNIFEPTLTIKENDVTLFTKNTEGVTYISLYNPGPVSAIYKWRKLKEEWRYISEEDDAEQVVDIILSDILKIMDLDLIDFENDSEPNISKRYQKLRCVLHRIDDPADIRGLLNEVIDDLDLTKKRYKLDWPATPPPVEPRMSVMEELLQNDNKLLNETSADVKEDINYDTKVFKDFEEDLHMHNDDILIHQDRKEVFSHISSIEDELNSKTLFFNNKFLRCPSTSALTEQTTSGTCVYHTLDQMLCHLKLEDSYCLSEPSSDTCDRTRSIYFFEKSAILQEHEEVMCALHIPPIRRGYEMCASFQLDVVGGKTQKFLITLVNLEKTLQLSKDSVYLGNKAWYENFKTNVIVKNITNYQMKLNIQPISNTPEKLPNLATGYVKIMNESNLILPPQQKAVLRIEGVMGFSEDFLRQIRITINEGDEMSLRLRGQGIMPILGVAKGNLPLAQQDLNEIIDEYRLLQKIYYFEMFKKITENDDEILAVQANEENEVKKSLSFLMELSSLSSFSSTTESRSLDVSARSTARRELEMRLFRILQTYVLINNNEELPNASILEQFLETERCLNHIRSSNESRDLLKMSYREYLRFAHKHSDAKIPINLKYFTVQPLPFQMRTHLLDMNNLKFNQYRKFVINLEFFGPGKLIVAARTAIKLPGLLVDFEIVESKGFLYYRCEEKLCGFQAKPYRNMYERLLDAEVDPKVKHAHSYDVNRWSHQHQRDISGIDRKCLMDQYNSLNKSIYMEQKHHITHCKIFSKCKSNFSGTTLNIIVLIRPEKELYEHTQRIEDYLYVDLHMGPTLPILLRGTIVDPDKDHQGLLSSSV